MKSLVLIIIAIVAVGLLVGGYLISISHRQASPSVGVPQSRAAARHAIEDLAVRFNAAIENQRDITPILDQVTLILQDYPGVTEGHILAGQAFAYQEQMESAYEHFAKALLDRPDDPQLQNLAGSTADMAGRLDDAEQHHARAVELAGSNPQILFSMADIHLKRERFDRAIELLEQAIAQKYVFPNARLALSDAYRQRAEPGDALRAIEQLELALTQLPSGDEHRPQREIFARKLAGLFAEIDDVPEAARILNSLSPPSRFTTGVSEDLERYYEKLDQPGMAALHYDMALSFEPTRADFAASAADWYFRSGDIPAASTMVGHLKKLQPDHAALHGLIQRLESSQKAETAQHD